MIGSQERELMMEKKFVLSFDGFMKRECPYTLEEAKVAWNSSIQNRYLYEYDCSVYELNPDGSVNRRVPASEFVS